MFEIYTKQVTISTATGDKQLIIRPLSGKHLPKLYAGMTKFFGDESLDGEYSKEAVKAFLHNLDEQTVADIHFICLETLVKSYPSENRDNLDEFASQNLLQLFPAVIEVNMSSKV